MCEHYSGYMSTGMSEKMWRTCARRLSCSPLYLFEGVRRWPGTQTLIPLSAGLASASRDPGLSFLLHHTSVYSYCYSVHPACHLKHTEPYCNYNWKRMETFQAPGVQTLPPFKLKYRNLHDFSFKGDSRWRWWFWKYILVSALSYWDELWPCSSTDGRV